MRVQLPSGTALSVDAKALNNEATGRAYNLRERERGSIIQQLTIEIHMEEVEIEIELRDSTFLIDADVDWHLMECECSSECGNQWVTESWKEVRIEHIQIMRVHYLTDSQEYKEIPINSLSKEDIMIVNDAIEQQINDQQ